MPEEIPQVTVQITYSAKELLERMESKIDTLTGDVREVIYRVNIIERDQAQKHKRRLELRDFLVAGGTIAAAIGGALGAVHIH